APPTSSSTPPPAPPGPTTRSLHDALPISRVNPQDIDQLQLGQKTLLRFSAFNQRTTPELNGIVSRVSADTTTDQRTGQSYYTLRDRKSTRLNSSHLVISYAVFCLKKKTAS